MPSPFPGMDSYLEGYLWPDAHNRLAVEISRRLASQTRPRDVARLEVRVVQDEMPEAEIGIMYPDPDVSLGLGATLSAIYGEAVYNLSIDYRQSPPPPELSTDEQIWMRTLLEAS
jgi:hypothetical protein